MSGTHTHTHTHAHTVGYSLWLWCVKVGRGREEGRSRRRWRKEEEEEDREEGAGCFLVMDLDCFLQVGVATSLWSFVEMIQPEPGARVGHVTWGGQRGQHTSGLRFKVKMN